MFRKSGLGIRNLLPVERDENFLLMGGIHTADKDDKQTISHTLGIPSPKVLTYSY